MYRIKVRCVRNQVFSVFQDYFITFFLFTHKLHDCSQPGVWVITFKMLIIQRDRKPIESRTKVARYGTVDVQYSNRFVIFLHTMWSYMILLSIYGSFMHPSFSHWDKVPHMIFSGLLILLGGICCSTVWLQFFIYTPFVSGSWSRLLCLIDDFRCRLEWKRN